ncbi:hypothetical protein M3M38_00015 [Fructilactobacillus cliffordii]|uniref:hypothetical protein n=1 Tax=Fructilactobacillus cliffordii TaxID=2940299 RepID=UPI00209320BC|nr:hypothetical protein [Fructilactobacillus cliffordii]USS86501.1 hypothetical protein M3M38_00015 [Fructilactobacillus cliffordii]
MVETLDTKLGTMFWAYTSPGVDDIEEVARKCDKLHVHFLDMPHHIDCWGNNPMNNHEHWDRIFDTLKAHGIVPHVYFQSNNYRTFTDPETHAIWDSKQMQTIRQGIIDFINRYAIRNPEIWWGDWNEPNGSGWVDSKERYDYYVIQVWEQLSKWIHDEIRYRNPESIHTSANYLGAPNSSHFDNVNNTFFSEYQYRFALYDDVDYLTWHPYVDTYNGEAIPEELLKQGIVPAEYNPLQKQLIATEFGFARGGGTGLQGRTWTDDEAAKLMIREILILDMMNYKRICFFCLTGSGNWDSNPYGAFNDTGKTDNYTQVGLAIKDLMDQLAGYHFVQRYDLDDEHLFALQYQNEAGDNKLAYWSTNSAGTVETPFRDENQELNFTDYVQITDLSFEPIKCEFFLPIEADSSLGTRVKL